jgi:poly-gamma-glutamate synthesis protein (capsule biosynthesis protein)
VSDDIVPDGLTSPAGAREEVIRPLDAGEASASLLIAGDLCVAASVDRPGGDLPEWQPLLAEISACDLAMVNLECPLSSGPHPIAKSGPALFGRPALAETIAGGGFGAVSLANNHILDAGPGGVTDTLHACEAAGLKTVGAGADLAAAEAPLSIRLAGLRVAVVACAEREFSMARPSSAGAAPLDPWRTPELVRAAADDHDATVVVLHGGNELLAVPRPGLVAACRALVHAGAAAVVCHHSHVAGPWEVYRGAPICYGTGNFLFPTREPVPPAWWQGYLVGLRLTARGVSSLRLTPYVQQAGRLEAAPMDQRAAAGFFDHLSRAAAVVDDPVALEAAWRRHCRERRPYYLSAALSLTRAERFLARKVPWPAWRRPRRRIPELLNLFRCDSHREAVETMLEEERWD